MPFSSVTRYEQVALVQVSRPMYLRLCVSCRDVGCRVCAGRGIYRFSVVGLRCAGYSVGRSVNGVGRHGS